MVRSKPSFAALTQANSNIRSDKHPRQAASHHPLPNSIMNRSRYVPQTAYSISPYAQQYGPAPASQFTAMMPPPQQTLAMPSSTYNPQPSMGVGHSPSSIWTPSFAAHGPIIEDLCAPPPPHLAGLGLSGSPPMGSLPPRMAALQTQMHHPGAMPQVQNVYGLPMHHTFAQHQQQQQQQQHMQQQYQQHLQQQQQHLQRVMVGSYPPYGVQQQQQQQHAQQMAFQQHQQHHQQLQQRGFDGVGAGMPGRTRLETGFPAAVMPVGAGNQGGMQGQVGSPNMGGSPGGGDGMGAPLTPVEEALRGFLSPDLNDLGH
ncbi:hypothetical protein BT67DRAFT_161178 [Trichocladium antarcticum]|uniref:Uncharacterized protein n=1 Tax=Trichocladium antarcticum TaxID=1450529 RepID=A0AAN6UE63_9PEZI|nr:hypothetical protein BT67DRAFT_161178 [Trichocladium antarcticum]